MSDKHPGRWNSPPGKEDIRPHDLKRNEKCCIMCGRVYGNKSMYMDNALGQRISITVCSNTCFANYVEKQARDARLAMAATKLDSSYAAST